MVTNMTSPYCSGGESKVDGPSEFWGIRMLEKRDDDVTWFPKPAVANQEGKEAVRSAVGWEELVSLMIDDDRFQSWAAA